MNRCVSARRAPHCNLFYTKKNLTSRQLGEDRVHNMYQSTGAPLHAAYALPQLRVWYQHNHKNAVAGKVVRWQTIASVCLCRWTGRASLPISYSEASWTGLLNFRTCGYDAAVLELLPSPCREALPALADYTGESVNNPPLQLPETIPPAGASSSPGAGGTRTDDDDGGGKSKKNPYFARWPALRGARLFLGVGDGAGANLGSKCSTVARIACTVGTSAAARVCLPLPIQSANDTNDDDKNSSGPAVAVEPGLFCYRVDRSHVLVGGALTDGGSVVEWMAELLNRPVGSDSFQECLRRAETLLDDGYASASSSSSEMVVPFFSGERSTGFRSRATGAILGLTLDTGPEHLLKACLEGVTIRLVAIVQLIRKVIMTAQSDGRDDDEQLRIICSGKALEKNDLWRQMLADCAGMDVVMDDETQEGTSRGVVILLASAMAWSDGVGGGGGERFLYETETINDSNTISPRTNGKDYWEGASRAQESLIDTLSPLWAANDP